MSSCRATLPLSTNPNKPAKLVLKAKPASKQVRFSGWTGACAGAGKKCKRPLTASIEATAIFVPKF
jgi:hypothetical protein